MTSIEAVPVEGRIMDLAPGGAAPGYAAHKVDQLARLRKVEGQMRGVSGMIEADRYCIDVLTQISAVTRALQEVALGLVMTTPGTACSTRPAPIRSRAPRSSTNSTLLYAARYGSDPSP
jgi:DNA-binding FrmR family transcriptional regulator